MKPSLNLSDSIASLTRPNPERDWGVAFIILILLALSLIAYAGYLFVDIRWGIGDLEGAQPVAPASQLSKEKIEAALTMYRTRGADFESRNFNVPAVSDPAK